MHLTEALHLSTVASESYAIDGEAMLRASLERRHLPALDGLRAVAVLTVMIYHFGANTLPGDLGVSLFFVLSGFLITWLLLGEERATGDISLRAFYTRRILRIFPAYYVFVALSFAIDTWRGHPWPPGLAASAAAYVVNYYNALHGHPVSSIAHAWSLAIEEQFYLLWPLAFRLLARRGRRTMQIVLVAIIVVVMLWRSYLYLVRGVGSAYVYDAFDTRFDNIAVGCLLAVCLEEERVVRAASAVGRSAWMPLVTLALIVWSRKYPPLRYHYGPGFTIDAIPIAILVVQMLQLYTTPLWSWLEHPIVRYIGIISYPMYLYHAWADSVGRHIRALPLAGQIVVSIIVTVVIASGSYYVVERPFLTLKRRFERRTVPVVATPAPVGDMSL